MKSKSIQVVALLIAIVGIGIGFAAFQSTLTISSSATVTPSSSSFNVAFSKATNSASTGSLASSNSTYGANATLAGTSISGINATFSAPGQSVTYTFYARNTGSYTAYLNSISMGTKTCTPASGVANPLVTAACNNISMSVSVNGTSYSSSQASLSSKSLAAGSYWTIIVTVSYTGTAYADENFTVSYGTTTLTFDSYD